MNLVIDAGNTLIKTAVFMGNEILSEAKFNHENFLPEIEKIFGGASFYRRKKIPAMV